MLSFPTALFLFDFSYFGQTCLQQEKFNLMENTPQKSNIANLVAKYPSLILNLEKLSVLILMIGLVLYFLEIKDTGFILVLGAILTAITYFLSAFQVAEIENLETTGILNSTAFINFVYKLTYLGLSIGTFASAGLIIKSAQVSTMIIISGLTLVFVLIISILTKINDRSKIYGISYYSRLLPCLLLLFYLANIQYHWI